MCTDFLFFIIPQTTYYINYLQSIYIVLGHLQIILYSYCRSNLEIIQVYWG